MTKYKNLYPLIMKKLNVKTARMYEILQKMEEEANYTLTRDEAILLLASNLKIDLRKHLTPEELGKVRELQISQPINITQGPQRVIKEIKRRVIPLSPDLKVSDPLLSNRVIKEAVEMAQIYIKLYVFENSVRNIINMVMEKVHGGNWWGNRVPLSIRRDVADRKAKEKNNPWHGRRGSHEIFYTMIGDLKSIITKNWKDFRKLFPNQTWVNVRIDEIEHSRNVVAHNNPLNKKDRDRITIYFKDWEDQVKEIEKDLSSP